MEEQEVTELKLRINNFIWANAPGEMTIKEADNAACKLLEAMVPGSCPWKSARVTELERECLP